MSKKLVAGILLGGILAGFLCSCGKHAMPEFENADMLAEALYAEAGIEAEDVIRESIDSRFAYALGLEADAFERMVEQAVVCRREIDSDGQTLYLLKMKTEDAAWKFSQDYYQHYEWAACDNAEKLVVACAGEYVLLFKSNSKQADAVLEGFRTLAGGSLAYQDEQINRG